MPSKKLKVAGLIIIMGIIGVIRFLTGCSDSSLFFTYGYNIRKGHIYYKQPFPDPVIELKDADAATFKVIKQTTDTAYADNGYFATDKNAVYYKGWQVTGSDGPSFEILDINFAKDKFQCYYRGSVIPGADPATFIVKNEQFSADKGHVFKRTVLIDNDTSVFETFDSSSITRTANAVSIYDEVVPIAPGVRFRHFRYNYFSLNGQLYFHNKPLPDGDDNGFIALDNFYSKTDKHVYYGEKIITGADPASYTLFASPYGRDARHIFFFEKMIAGADIQTFEVINLNFQCARDKHAVYHEDKRITQFTKADLENKNSCTNCDEASIHFAEAEVK